jgi:hypothetical protein
MERVRLSQSLRWPPFAGMNIASATKKLIEGLFKSFKKYITLAEELYLVGVAIIKTFRS